MATSNKNPEIDRYIASFPVDTRLKLERMRAIILKAAPGAEEVIGYQMPAYRLNGILVYFAGYKAHIGFYPTGSGVAAFQKELSVYKSAKGSVQFPLDKPLPAALITRMVKFRVKENREKAAGKAQQKASKQTAPEKALKKAAAKKAALKKNKSSTPSRS